MVRAKETKIFLSISKVREILILKNNYHQPFEILSYAKILCEQQLLILNKIHFLFWLQSFITHYLWHFPFIPFPCYWDRVAQYFWCSPLRRHTEKQQEKTTQHIKITRGRGCRKGKKIVFVTGERERQRKDRREGQKRTTNNNICFSGNNGLCL